MSQVIDPMHASYPNKSNNKVISIFNQTLKNMHCIERLNMVPLFRLFDWGNFFSFRCIRPSSIKYHLFRNFHKLYQIYDKKKKIKRKVQCFKKLCSPLHSCDVNVCCHRQRCCWWCNLLEFLRILLVGTNELLNI